jgi:hypothetical protein
MIIPEWLAESDVEGSGRGLSRHMYYDDYND